MGADEPEIDDGDFDAAYAKFFELIGHCITLYQTLEDHLPNMFAAALGGDVDRAKAIFGPYRGLEAKLDGISAALLDADETVQQRWKRLRLRIKTASERRGKIAHARTLLRSGTIAVTIDSGTGRPTGSRRTTTSKMELRKSHRKGVEVWDNKSLFQEYTETERTFGLLIGLTRHMRGESVPDHLQE